jgi:hypothetical protein
MAVVPAMMYQCASPYLMRREGGQVQEEQLAEVIHQQPGCLVPLLRVLSPLLVCPPPEPGNLYRQTTPASGSEGGDDILFLTSRLTCHNKCVTEVLASIPARDNAACHDSCTSVCTHLQNAVDEELLVILSLVPLNDLCVEACGWGGGW